MRVTKEKEVKEKKIFQMQLNHWKRDGKQKDYVR